VHLTGIDLAIIGALYVAAITLILALARAPRNLRKPPPRAYPRLVALVAMVALALVCAAVATLCDPAAADLLARLINRR
jgi:hypothetical protein